MTILRIPSLFLKKKFIQNRRGRCSSASAREMSFTLRKPRYWYASGPKRDRFAISIRDQRHAKFTLRLVKRQIQLAATTADDDDAEEGYAVAGAFIDSRKSRVDQPTSQACPPPTIMLFLELLGSVHYPKLTR